MLNDSEIKPVSITFLSGRYKGQILNLGGGVIETTHDQTADWMQQDGHSLRVGANFRQITPRTFQLQLEFYSPDEDISRYVENIATLQEIDETTGQAPTVFYQEGEIKVAPVVCTGLKITKNNPFPGGKGFHLAKVDLSLKLLGGKTSEHRFAKPLMETELTQLAEQQTRAERERLGTIAVVEQVLANCLSEEENSQLADLLREQQLQDVNAVRQLSPSAFIQAATAGLIPIDTLNQLQDKLRGDLAHEIARKTDGAGAYAETLRQMILGGTGALPADLQEQLPQLQGEYQEIYNAIFNQQLTQQSPIFTKGSTAQRLISIASCGLTMRQSGASGINRQQQLPPEWRAFFESKLQEQANDSTARDQLILDEVNKALGDSKISDETIQERFGLTSPEQAQALRNGAPYATREEFNQRAGGNGIAARAAWGTFIDYQVGNTITR